MEIKVLKRLLKVENISGIYRNYFLHKKKRLIITHFIMASILQAGFLHCGYSISYETHKNDFAVLFLIILFRALPFVYYIFAGISSLKNQECFKVFIVNLDIIHGYFKEDISYIKLLRISETIGALVMISYCLTAICFLITRILDRISWLGVSNISVSFLILLLSQSWLDICFMFEQIIVIFLLVILYKLLKTFNYEISLAEKELKKTLKLKLEYGTVIENNLVEKWFKIYLHFTNCCKQFNICFGVQILLTLIISCLHFLFTIYRILNVIITNAVYSYFPAKNLFFILFSHFAVTMSIIISAQMLHNEADLLSRTLSRINCLLSTSREDPVSKRVKDLSRLIASDPIRIRLVTMLPLDMYLLPLMLSLTVGNVIVFLQFNKVI